MVERPEPSREAALARLDDFIPHAGRDYARTRNFDLGPERRDNVSMLSPWLRHRLVLEEEVIARTLARHSLSAAEKFVQEIVWRTYFKGFLEQRPSIWRAYRRDVAALAERLEAEPRLRADYDAAVAGRTGIDCFDAWALELVETGYLHNHARMWFASIWIFTLRLPWQLGADFFLRHLLDGDPASNTLGWRWVGGLHTRGKTYLARPDNIAKFTDGRFNPSGQLAKSSPPLAEDEEHPLVPLCAPDAASPRCAGLLITEEDCTPETLDLPEPPAALLGLTATEARSPLPVAEAVRNFTRGAVANGLAMAHAVEGVAAEQASGAADWSAILLDWARANNLDAIMTAHAPVGPAAERLAAARGSLSAAGVTVMELRRDWDVAAWPHATGGFFKVKAKIPALLSAAGIAH